MSEELIQSIISSDRDITLTIKSSDIKALAKALLAEHDSQNKKEDPVGGPMLTRAEVAKNLGVAYITLQKWDAEGYLKCVKVGRKCMYRQEDIDRFLKARK